MGTLLSHKDLRRLKAFILSCCANPDILYIPQLGFFKVYLESLGAKIPVYSGKIKNKGSSTSNTVGTYLACQTSQIKQEECIEDDFHPTSELPKTDPTSNLLNSGKSDDVIIDNLAYTNRTNGVDIPGEHGHHKENVSDYEITENSTEEEEFNSYECSKCDKDFTSSYGLKRHMKIHSKKNMKPHICNLCGKSFSRKKLLVTHTPICIKRSQCDANREKRIACPECRMCFSTSSDLSKHIKIHTGEKPYKCIECGKSFLHKHHYEEHTGEKPYCCNQCENYFTTSSALSAHVKKFHNGEKTLKCNQCYTVFFSSSLLQIHNNTKHIENSEGDNFVCSQCGHSFSSNGDLTEHLETHAGEIPSGDITLKCNQCESFFLSKLLLQTHMWTEHILIGENCERKMMCAKCGKSFSSNGDLTKHLKIHTGDKPYQCTQCGKSFLRKHQYRDHARIHTGEKPYQCNQCQNCFTSDSALRSHVKRIHIGEKTFKCNLCESAFFTRLNLTRHMSNKHTGEKPYKCHHCDKSYPDKYGLKDHIKIHTNENNVKCSLCDKICLNKDRLKSHMISHSGEKPYLCAQCGKSFSTNGDLTKHTRIHSGEKPYQCNQCDKSFLRNKDYKNHIRLHTGEKPYQCKQCEKYFTSNGALRIHVKAIHIGEKTFKCEDCETAFFTKVLLARHMSKKHTGERPYKCQHCDKSFAVECDVKTHMKIHIGIKSFECSQCHKAFSLKANLQQHKRIHSLERPFQCTLCDKNFKLKASLTKHLKIHKILPDEMISSDEKESSIDQYTNDETENDPQILNMGPECTFIVPLLYEYNGSEIRPAFTCPEK